MKKRQLSGAAVIIAFGFITYGCEKSEACRTCTASYRNTGGGTNTTIATKKACSTQEEEDFKTEYNYADVRCE